MLYGKTYFWKHKLQFLIIKVIGNINNGCGIFNYFETLVQITFKIKILNF